jgi:hypothetical protein
LGGFTMFLFIFAISHAYFLMFSYIILIYLCKLPYFTYHLGRGGPPPSQSSNLRFVQNKIFLNYFLSVWPMQQPVNYVFFAEIPIFHHRCIASKFFPEASIQPPIVLYVVRSMLSLCLYFVESLSELGYGIHGLENTKMGVDRSGHCLPGNFPIFRLHTKSDVLWAPKKWIPTDVW